MPRRPREEAAGAIHHVYARGNRRQPIYVDDEDRQTYLRILGLVVRTWRWRCLAYCLMGNHLHLLIETPQPNLGGGMHQLHGTYARRFNDRHDHIGHLFQKRYEAKRVRTDEQLCALVRYLAMNPVKAGLCSAPELWRWSSTARRPDWLDHPRLLEFIGADGGNASRRYAELIGATNPQPS
jgi:REP element-mobilizing transposase RayT